MNTKLLLILSVVSCASAIQVRTQRTLQRAQRNNVQKTAQVTSSFTTSDSLAAVVQSYEQRILFLEAEIRRLSGLRTVAEVDDSVVVDLQVRIDQLARENDNLRREIDDDDDEAIIDDLRNQISELTAQNVRLDAKLQAALSVDVDGLRSRIEALGKNNVELRGELAEARAANKQIAVLSAEISRLREKNNKLNEENKVLREKPKVVVDNTKLNAANAENKELKASIAALNVELSNNASEINRLNMQSRDDAKKIKRLSVRLRKANEENDDLQNQLNESNKKNNAVQFEIVSLKAVIENLEDRARKSDANEKNSAGVIAALRASISDLKNENSAANLSINNLQNKLESARDAIKRWENTAAKLNANLKTLSDDLAESEDNNSSLQAQISALNGQILDLEAQLDAASNVVIEDNSDEIRRHFEIIEANLKSQIGVLQARIIDLEGQLGLQGSKTKVNVEINGQSSISSNVDDIIRRNSGSRTSGFLIGDAF